MDRLSRKKAQRFRFMNRLYEITDGNQMTFVDMWEVGAELSFTREETEGVVQYLEGEGLLQYRAIGGIIGITHQGSRRVEEALSAPDRETRYFPPVNIINIRNMTGSQIQQGTARSKQEGAFSLADPAVLQQLASEVKAALPQLGLVEDDRQEAEAEVATIEAQLSSNRPKPVVIRESLSTLRNILEGAAGSLIASGLAARIAQHLR